jgi:hypothetical protein
VGNTAIESFLSNTFCIISFCSDLSCRWTFTHHFLFIHNHLTLRKGCCTRLQHDLPLDPIISPYHFHFRTYKRDLAILNVEMCQGRVGAANPLFSLWRALWRPTAPASLTKSRRTAEESRTSPTCVLYSKSDPDHFNLYVWNGSIWLVLSHNQVNQIIQQIRHGYRLLIYKATSRRKWYWRLLLTKSISGSLLLYNTHVGLVRDSSADRAVIECNTPFWG